MKKVLIVTFDFPPYSAPRMGYLCKYLKRYGWEPFVIALYHDPKYRYDYLADPSHTYWVYERGKPIRKWYHHLLNYFSPYDVYCREQEMVDIGTILCTKHKFELVLGNTCVIKFPLWAAYQIAKRNKLPLMVDFRDIPEQNGANWKYWLTEWKNAILRKIVITKAAKVSVVSPFYSEVFSQKYGVECELIYNGFDAEISVPQQPCKDTCFHIVYTGLLYGLSLRNPELLLAGMKQMKSENLITEDNFAVDFYADEKGFQSIRELAVKEGVEDFLHYYGFIPAQQVPEKLSQASMLLLLANKPGKQNAHVGIIPGKLFDYMAMRRPILCVSSDEGILEQTIHDNKVGLAARTREEAYHFIRHYFDIWKRNGFVPLTDTTNNIQKFSREEQAKQFIHAFEEISSAK